MNYDTSMHLSMSQLENLATGGIEDADTRTGMLEHLVARCKGTCRRLLDEIPEGQEMLEAELAERAFSREVNGTA